MISIRSICTVAAIMAAACGRTNSPATEAEAVRFKADALHTKAVALQAKPNKAEKAARLHEASARLRPPSDPRAYDCFAEASQLLVAAGESRRARSLMERSAEFALTRGDSLNAARALAEALMLASRQEQHRDVLRLGQRLAAIAHTPAVPWPDVQALNARVAQSINDANTALGRKP